MMITYTQEELSSIVHAFAFPGTITDWTPHGNGHINDTFLVRSTENGVIFVTGVGITAYSHRGDAPDTICASIRWSAPSPSLPSSQFWIAR